VCTERPFPHKVSRQMGNSHPLFWSHHIGRNPPKESHHVGRYPGVTCSFHTLLAGHSFGGRGLWSHHIGRYPPEKSHHIGLYSGVEYPFHITLLAGRVFGHIM